MDRRTQNPVQDLRCYFLQKYLLTESHWLILQKTLIHGTEYTSDIIISCVKS